MKTWMVGLAILVFGGCTALPAPPLHSAWYMQYDPVDKKSLLYVALLNRGGRDIDVKDVILNRGKGESKIGWSLDIAPTSLPSGKEGKLVLHPGRLVVLPSKKFKRTKDSDEKWRPERFDAQCFLPVEVAVELAAEQPWFEQWFSRAHGDPDGMIRADLVGRMPSSLPDNWDCPP